MADDFATHQAGLTSPAQAGEMITPHNSQPLTYATRALYVGGTGDVRVVLVGGDTLTLRAAQAGVIYPLRVFQVLASGTTATDLVGLR